MVRLKRSHRIFLRNARQASEVTEGSTGTVCIQVTQTEDAPSLRPLLSARVHLALVDRHGTDVHIRGIRVQTARKRFNSQLRVVGALQALSACREIEDILARFRHSGGQPMPVAAHSPIQPEDLRHIHLAIRVNKGDRVHVCSRLIPRRTEARDHDALAICRPANKSTKNIRWITVRSTCCARGCIPGKINRMHRCSSTSRRKFVGVHVLNG